MRLAAIISAFALGLSGSAGAVLIDSGDGTGNSVAPVPDPGWHNVGACGAQTGIYLGGRFALTANHVGPQNLTLDGVTYRYVPGTAVELDNGDGTDADLVVFQIYPAPPLPALALPSATPAAGTTLIMVGRGVNRGPATTFDPNGPAPPDPVSGYEWGSGQTMRWGTNAVIWDLRIELIDGTQTMALGTSFDQAGSTYEAQGAVGDSGGAAFAWNGSRWELVGVLFAIGARYTNQPADTSLYGNLTMSADLAFYRSQIDDVMAMPEPRGGLWLAAALLATLSRRGRARYQSLPRSSTRR
jgi:hypothetical protein